MAPSNARFMNVKEELKNITTINLISNATSILEKILWVLIAIFGSLFIYDVVVIQLENWRQNPSLVTKEMRKLSDLPVPSVTFCHKGLQKYGLVENLANLIDPEKNLPREVLAIRNEFLKAQFQKIKSDIDILDFCRMLSYLEGDEREDNPILRGQEDMYESECQVRK